MSGFSARANAINSLQPVKNKLPRISTLGIENTIIGIAAYSCMLHPYNVYSVGHLKHFQKPFHKFWRFFFVHRSRLTSSKKILIKQIFRHRCEIKVLPSTNAFLFTSIWYHKGSFTQTKLSTLPWDENDSGIVLLALDPFGETTAHQHVYMYSRNAQGGKASKKVAI